MTAAVAKIANARAGMLAEERGRCSGLGTNSYEGEGYRKGSAISIEPSLRTPPQAPCGASEKGQGNIHRPAGTCPGSASKTQKELGRKRRSRPAIVWGTTALVK